MKTKNHKTLAIILGILLLGSLIFNIVQYERTNKLENESFSQTIEFKVEKEALQNQLDSLDFEIRNLQDLNLKTDSTLQATLIDLDNKKRMLQDAINKGNMSKQEFNSLKSQIQSLKNEVSKYKTEIERLTNENIQLRGKNDTLSTTNTRISNERDSISSNYNQVKQKYDNTASMIQKTVSVSNFYITPLKVKKSGKEVVKDKSNKVNKLKVSFKLDPNTNGVSESKTLYIAIYKPDGSLATFKNGTQGVFNNKDGVSTKYSDKIDVSYNKDTGAAVPFDWDYDNFTPGTYRIQIYQNGFKIGEESRTLR